MEVIDQDDVFFADLSKQISLLIMEDDDEEFSVLHCRQPYAPFQAFSRVIHPRQITESQMLYGQSCNTEQSKGTGVFIHIEQSKGTGVFIPRSTQLTRKNKQGKFNTTTPRNTKFHKHSDASSRGLSQELASNKYNSFSHKRS